jgi:hypothetical protein
MRRLAGKALIFVAALAALRLWKAQRYGRDLLGRTMGGNTGGRKQGVAAFACGALLISGGLDRLGDFRGSVLRRALPRRRLFYPGSLHRHREACCSG